MALRCGCDPPARIICDAHCQWQGCTDDGKHTDACVAGERLGPDRPCERCGCAHTGDCLTCGCTCEALSRHTCPCCKASDADIVEQIRENAPRPYKRPAFAELDGPQFADMREHFVDLHGNPIGPGDWARLRADRKACVLATDEVALPDGSSTEVRTMWTGHVDVDAGARPFGTVQGARPVRVLEEYDTREQALAGHPRWVRYVSMGGSAGE